MKRRETGEAVISETDKSGKATISTRIAYRKMGEEHVQNDKPITWTEYRKIKEEILDHTKALSYVFNPEKQHG